MLETFWPETDMSCLDEGSTLFAQRAQKLIVVRTGVEVHFHQKTPQYLKGTEVAKAEVARAEVANSNSKAYFIKPSKSVVIRVHFSDNNVYKMQKVYCLILYEIECL